MKIEKNLKFFKQICCFLFLFLSISKPLLAQTIDSANAPINIEKAIKIAERKGYYIPTNESTNPAVLFNKTQKEWEITSTIYSHSNKGMCKFTNGCTIVTKKHIMINAEDGKINKKYTEVQSYSNYE